ncbi:MAG TPA: hypothetical protein VL382_03350 [Terriglobales bacterium]|nr:hypothetical protein [Terriglobales bacterium]
MEAGYEAVAGVNPGYQVPALSASDVLVAQPAAIVGIAPAYRADAVTSTVAQLVEPAVAPPAEQANADVVILAMVICLVLMTIFTVALTYRTRTRPHPLRVVRWPR